MLKANYYKNFFGNIDTFIFNKILPKYNHNLPSWCIERTDINTKIIKLDLGKVYLYETKRVEENSHNVRKQFQNEFGTNVKLIVRSV